MCFGRLPYYLRNFFLVCVIMSTLYGKSVISIPRDSDLIIMIESQGVHSGELNEIQKPALSIAIYEASGDAEVSGCPICWNNEVSMSHGNIALVHSQRGVTLILSYYTDSSKVHLKYPATSNYHLTQELHAHLNKKRSRSMRNHGAEAPKTLVIGKSCLEKQNIILSLLNFACRDMWSPIFVDMNPENPVAHVLGCISLTIWDHSCPIDEISSTIASFHTVSIIEGSFSPCQEMKNDALIKFMGDSILQNSEPSSRSKLRSSGVILHMIDNSSIYEILGQLIIWNITDLVVVENLPLKNYIEGIIRTLPDTNLVKGPLSRINLWYIPIAVKNVSTARVQADTHYLTGYFYGLGKIKVNPFIHQIPFAGMSLWRKYDKILVKVSEDAIHLNTIVVLFEELKFKKCSYFAQILIGIVVEKLSSSLKILFPTTQRAQRTSLLRERLKFSSDLPLNICKTLPRGSFDENCSEEISRLSSPLATPVNCPADRNGLPLNLLITPINYAPLPGRCA